MGNILQVLAFSYRIGRSYHVYSSEVSESTLYHATSAKYLIIAPIVQRCALDVLILIKLCIICIPSFVGVGLKFDDTKSKTFPFRNIIG